MNNKDFISALATRTGKSAKEMQKLATSLSTGMVELLNDETSLVVSGFGTFEVKKKMERIIVNPVSKQRKLVPPKLVLAFRPGNTLKDKLK